MNFNIVAYPAVGTALIVLAQKNKGEPIEPFKYFAAGTLGVLSARILYSAYAHLKEKTEDSITAQTHIYEKTVKGRTLTIAGTIAGIGLVYLSEKVI